MELAHGEDFIAVNVPTTFEHPTDVQEYFSLQAPPNTSIWRKPSACDDTSAPMILKRLGPSFNLAEVTVSASLSEEFDQAGIVIFAGSLPGPTTSPLPRTARRLTARSRGGDDTRDTGRWAKAGLELIKGELHATSVVAISPCGADWTTSARLPLSSSAFGPRSIASQSLRVKLERVGESLWIGYLDPESQTASEQQHHMANPFIRRPNPEDTASDWRQMREVMGFFANGWQKEDVWVGCYASRPLEFEPMHNWETPVGMLAEFEDLDII